MVLTQENPVFDPDLFVNGKSKRFVMLTYTDNEIVKIIEFLYPFTSNHPIFKDIIALLQDTFDFKCATAMEKDAVLLRQEFSEPEKLALTLNTMSVAIKDAEHKLSQFSKDKKVYNFLFTAIEYTKEQVRHRMNELKETNDIFYKNQWHNSDLIKLL